MSLPLSLWAAILFHRKQTTKTFRQITLLVHLWFSCFGNSGWLECLTKKKVCAVREYSSPWILTPMWLNCGFHSRRFEKCQSNHKLMESKRTYLLRMFSINPRLWMLYVVSLTFISINSLICKSFIDTWGIYWSNPLDWNDLLFTMSLYHSMSFSIFHIQSFLFFGRF